MIELNELIKHYSTPPSQLSPWRNQNQEDTRLSTLAYLNGYRVTIAMLRDLAGNATDLEAEARLP